jgi:transmembrane sensor
MSGREVTPGANDPLTREAAGWFARMRGPDAEASREQFEAWLRRGALHRRAYNRASEIFAMGKLLTDEAAVPPSRDQGRRRVVIAAVVTAALAALVLLVLFTPHPLSPGGRSDSPLTGQGPQPLLVLSAPVGEARAFALADGSIVTLDGGSSLEVRLGSAERRLDLERGRARFKVFHEPRPFVVHAGGGSVTARGTVFEIELGRNRRVTVRLIEGRIDVSLPREKGSPVPGIRRLQAGMTVSFAAAKDEHGAAATPRPRSPAPQSPPAGAARDFEAVTIAEIVAEANLASSRPIRLADEAIGRRKVSGRFRIDDGAVLAQRLALLFGLRVDGSDPRQIILRPT